MIIKLNGEIYDLELLSDRCYCETHQKFVWAGDEGNCCILAMEEIWLAQDRWKASWEACFNKSR